MAGKRGELSPEEQRLWARVVADVTPLGEPAQAPAEPPAQPQPASAPADGPAGGTAAAQPRREPATPGGGGLDRRTERRFRRGELGIEARLDLHGYRQHEAHNALAQFVERARLRGLRCVLVITGKGSYGAEGVLRAAVPRWLAEPGLSRHVVATAPARRQHGGDGALYLLIRRNRSRG